MQNKIIGERKKGKKGHEKKKSGDEMMASWARVIVMELEGLFCAFMCALSCHI